MNAISPAVINFYIVVSHSKSLTSIIADQLRARIKVLGRLGLGPGSESRRLIYSINTHTYIKFNY